MIPKNFRPTVLKIFYAIRSPLYLGNTVECPCCGGQFNTFLPFTGYHHTRKNAQCPRCGSLERHRLLWLFLKNKTDLFTKPAKLLHFAPELILQKKLRTIPGISYIGTDIDSPLADVKMDIHQIIYEEKTIDAIIIYHVLDHVKDDRLAMREMYRVLKPGGWAIIQSSVNMEQATTFEDPAAVTPKDKLRIYGQVDLARKYGRDFIDRLSETGFEVHAEQYGLELEPAEVAKYGVIRGEYIFYCLRTD